MKPSQFLYSENVKEQKGQKSIITKSQAELRPLTKPASQPKDQNASMIYSLVTLPVKDGKKEEIVFPESLISQHLKLDKEKIVGKNTELARKLKKLKPLDNDLSSSISTPDQEKVKPKNEQLQGPRLQVYIKALNDITGGQFKKTQSHLLFGSIEQKIQKSNVLCLVKFKSLKFFNQYDLTNDKIPGLFCWEVKHKGKSLVKTTPKEYDKVQQDLLDFTFKRHSYESPQVILWKIKNNDEKYLGQFNLDNQDFMNLTEILDYKGKKIVESTTEKEMFRTMKQTKSYLGNVEFQIIQLGHEQLPQNKHSGIPGSPRTDEEKLRHRLIDLVMSGAQYRWRFDENERLIIEEIQQASQELVAEYIIEQVVDASGKMGDIMITKFLNYAEKGRGYDQRLQDMLSNPQNQEAVAGLYRLQKRYKKEEFDQVIAILSQLDQQGTLKACDKYLTKIHIKDRKVNFATAEAALQKAGVSQEIIAELLKNDLGLNLFDFFLKSKDLAFEDILKDIKFDENTSYIMSESKTPPDAVKGSYRIMGRTYRREHFDQVMNTLAELNANGSLVEVKEELQRMGLKGRVTRKDIENTLAKAGVNANQLFILTTNDLGLNLLDMFLSSDQLANALIAFQQVNLVEEEELNLESISENLFKIIGKKVRRNHQLAAVKEFVIALDKKPELARLFYNYSYAPENYVNDIPPFIQNFNLKNYEHIYILGRMLKLFEKWEVKTPFYDALKKYHVEAKKNIYFEIPCFPKDMDLEDKKDSLTLGALSQNILHEVARRQKWEKLYKAFDKYSKWAFEKDFRGESAFQQMLEKASYDVIKLFFTNYPEQLAERFGELEIQPVLQQNARKGFEHHFDVEKQKNYLHSLIENPNLSQQELLESLQLVEALINQKDPNNFNILKKQKVQQEFTPFLYFLGYLEERSRKKADRVLREIGSSLFIIQLLKVEDDDEEDNNNQGQDGDGDGGNDKKKQQKPQSDTLFKILSKFPEQIFEKLDDSFKELNWLTNINKYYQFHHLVKHKQQKKLIQLISQMAQDINKFEYDPKKYNDEECQTNKDIVMFMIQMVGILLEIKALKNRSLDQISQQIIFLLRFWVKKYAELLSFISYFNDEQYPHLIRKFKYKEPQTLFELFYNFQLLTVLQELKDEDLHRIEFDDLYTFLNGTQNIEGLKQIVAHYIEVKSIGQGIQAAIQSGLFEYITTEDIRIKYLISTDPDSNEFMQDSKDKLFVHLTKNQSLVKPDIYFIFDYIQPSTVKMVIEQKISDQFLKLLQKLPDHDIPLECYNQEVYKRLVAGQNIDIPLTQLIQQNMQIGQKMEQIESFLKRSQNPKHQALLYLFDKDFIATSSTPKFNQALKELIKTIDVKKSFYQIVNNAQYDKIDAFIGATNAAQQKLDLDTIRDAISQVAELGYLQITDFQKYLEAIKGKKSDFYISPFDPGAFFKMIGRGQETIPKLPQDKTDLEILFDETAANPYLYSVSRVCYQKKKIQQIKFPENLNKIRVPMSTYHQLIEMNPGLEEEIKQAWDQGWSKNKRFHQERLEEHLQRDIWLFKYTKHLRYTFLSQNVKSVFFKMESFVSAPQSYRKTFDSLLKIYNKAGIPLSTDPEVIKKVIVTGILFNQFQMDTILQLLAPIKVQDFIIIDIVQKIYDLTKKNRNLNQFQKQIQQKNLQNYITFTQKLLRNVNIKKYQQDEEKITQIQELVGSIRSSLAGRRADQVEFKYAYELLQLIVQFDEKELEKFQLKDTFIDIAKALQKKKPQEKLTLQLVKKYQLKPYQQDYNKILEDTIAAAKKSNAQEFLENNYFKKLIGKFGDEKSFRIFKEVFKQKLNKEQKEYLLQDFYNIELFNTLFFYRTTKTYNFLINDVLHKQIFNSNTMMTKQILQALIDKGQVEWMEENKVKEKNEEAISILQAAVQEFDDLAIEQSQTNEAEAEQDDGENENEGDGDAFVEQVNADAPKQQKKPIKSIQNKPKKNDLFQASYFKKRFAVIQEEQKGSIYKQILLRKELENLYAKIEVKKTQIKRRDDPNYKPGESPFNARTKKVQNDDDQQEEQEEQLSNDEQTLLVLQAQVLNFYEFFETIQKFQLQSHYTQDTSVNIVSRFKFLSEDQIQQQIKQFEELGYEYIVKALKVQRYFLINWNSLDNNFESVLFLLPLMSLRLITPTDLFTRHKSQQELLKIVSRSKSKPQIFDQIFEQIRDQYVTIDISKKFNAIQIKQFGFDRGIKIASRIVDEDPEEYYPNIRKMKPVKPWIGIDAFLENSPNYKQQVLILNDNNFKQVLDPYFNNINTIQEFCVDPEDIFYLINKEQTDKSLIPYKEVLYPILVNFPQIIFFQGYKERWLETYSLFYNIELSLVILKSILVNDSNLIGDYIDLLMRILSTIFKKEEEGEEEQQQVEQEQPEVDEYIDEEYESEVEVDATDSEEEPQIVQQPPPKIAQAENPPKIAQAEKKPVNSLSLARAGGEQQDPDAKDDEPKQDDDPDQFDAAPRKRQEQQEQQEQQPEQKDESDRNEEQAAQPVQQDKPKKKKMIKVKKTRKVLKPKPEKQEAPFKSEFLDELINTPMKAIHANIFTQFLMIAISNDKALHALQNSFIEYKLIKAPEATKQYDKVVTDRLIAAGYKGPFDAKFVNLMDSKIKELKQPIIDDVKHIKKILNENENLEAKRFRNLFQVIITQVLAAQCDLDTYVQTILQSHPYRLLSQKKANVFQVPLDKDDKFQIEIRQNFDHLDISRDFLDKYFENISSHTSLDKWIQTLYLFRYLKKAKQQMEKIENTSYEFNYAEYEILYRFIFKNSKSFDNLVYQVEKVNPGDSIIDSENQYLFKFHIDIIINIAKTQNYPVPYINSKYEEEIQKLFDAYNIEQFKQELDENGPFLVKIPRVIAQGQQVNYDNLFKQINQENFRKIKTLITQQYLFLQNEQFEHEWVSLTMQGQDRKQKRDWKKQLYEREFWEGIDLITKYVSDNPTINDYMLFADRIPILRLRDALRQGQQTDYKNSAVIDGATYQLYNDRVRPELKIKIQDKLYPLPYSNYQLRQRNATYKVSVGCDLCFPEFYPFLRLHRYVMVPELVPKKSYYEKFDTVIALQQTCNDLNAYSSLFQEFTEQLPELDEDGFFLLPNQVQNVSWPILVAENGYYSAAQDSHPLYLTQYLHQRLQLRVDKLSNNYKYNVLSITEIILNKITRVVQATTNKKCKIQTAVNIFEDWTFFKKVITRIDQVLTQNELNVFKFYYVEVNEAHPNSTHQLRPKQEGLDAVFRFGPTNFYVHSNVLIIRLNLALVSENGQTIVNPKSQKQRIRDNTDPSAYDQDISNYLNAIVNYDDLLKQLFAKK